MASIANLDGRIAHRPAPSGMRRLAQIKRTSALYIMLLPPLIYLIFFHYAPMYGAQIAFREYKINLGIWNSEWVGFKYFTKFFNDYMFGRLLRNTLRVSLYSLIVNFLVRTVLSLMINCLRGERFKKLFQTITYMPHFISTVVMVGILIRFFDPNLGAISKVIQLFGGTDRNLFSVSAAIPHLYVWSGVWQNAGWSTILFLAALTSVDREQHEAAIVDGATRIRRVIHIDIPALLPTMVICLILDCGRVMSLGFEKMLLMQNSANLSTTQIISTYVYTQGIAGAFPKYSYATAIGLFNSVINFALIILVNQVARRLNQSSLW